MGLRLVAVKFIIFCGEDIINPIRKIVSSQDCLPLLTCCIDRTRKGAEFLPQPVEQGQDVTGAEMTRQQFGLNFFARIVQNFVKGVG